MAGSRSAREKTAETLREGRQLCVRLLYPTGEAGGSVTRCEGRCGVDLEMSAEGREKVNHRPRRVGRLSFSTPTLPR